VVSPGLFGQCEFGHLARASSLCGACKEACPVDIDLPKLLLRVRAGIGVDKTRNNAKSNAPVLLGIGLGLFTLAATSQRRFISAQRLAAIFGSLATLFSKDDPWIRLPAFSGWGYSKDFPRPAAKPFRTRYFRQINSEADKQDQSPAKSSTPASISSKVDTLSHISENLYQRFADELEALGAKFVTCHPDDITQKILEILRSNDIDEILAWDAAYLPEGLLERLTEADIRIIFPTTETVQTNSHVRAGLSGASAAIAETGSLLLLGGPGRPLAVSLLPEIHIALVNEEDILTQLSQVLQLDEIKQAPAAVLISGPSRTADIEMTLTIGVHGPGELYVICMDGR
jgi:L-lactate dehydrogenase complex protein LldG